MKIDKCLAIWMKNAGIPTDIIARSFGASSQAVRLVLRDERRRLELMRRRIGRAAFLQAIADEKQITNELRRAA